MIKTIRFLPVILGCLILMVVCVLGQGNGAIEVSDHFELKGKASGSQLHRRSIEPSGMIWEASPNVLIAGEGDQNYVSISSPDSFVGRVALPPDLQMISVEAELHPVSRNGKSNWIAVGIGKSALNNPTLGGLYLTVNTEGTYALLFNPEPKDNTSAAAVLLKGGRIPAFNAENMTRVKLTYELETGTASVSVNDQVMVNHLDLNAKGIKVPLVYAGFGGYGQPGGAINVDNFTVSFGL